MDIDSEHLGAPNTGYQSIVRTSAATFARIFRDLGSIGEPGRGRHMLLLESLYPKLK